MRLLNKEQIINLPDHFFPMVVLADNRKSFFSKAIKAHTHGQYSHAMWMREPFLVVSQNGRLAEKYITDYLQPWYRLKFFSYPEMSEREESEIHQCLNAQLARRSRYDWLGIFGQLFNIRKLNFSSRYYCSEAVWEPFVKVWGYKQTYPSPSELDSRLPRIGWEIVGIYDPTLLPGA